MCTCRNRITYEGITTRCVNFPRYFPSERYDAPLSGDLIIPKSAIDWPPPSASASHPKQRKEGTHRERCRNSELVSKHHVGEERDRRYQDGCEGPYEGEHQGVEPGCAYTVCQLKSGARKVASDIHLIIHFISTSRASSTRLIQRSSHAKNLMSLT